LTKHHETRLLPYKAEQMYDLVADVARYPEFLPWCAAARIRSRQPQGAAELIEADLVISFKVFRERFGSRVLLWPDEKRIDTEYLDGPFRYLRSGWEFRPAPATAPAVPGGAGAVGEGAATAGGCEVEFHVDFEFRNPLLQGVIGVVFNEAMQRVVRAFEQRAAALYGPDGRTSC
jgi:coenzyme Q-binding protein COQ10